MEDVRLQPDGLVTPGVGAWSEDKYDLIRLYANLFATGMKYKWNQRVFIDLYSGAGIAKIKDTNKLVMGSPLIGLTVKDSFDHYIFCDEDSDKVEALRRRAHGLVPAADPDFIVGDANQVVERIARLIPAASSTNKVLSLCILDPYDIGIKFATIQKLCQNHFVDFLILLAVYMDANRNYSNYLKSGSTKVEDFLGLQNWRDRWREQEQAGVEFPDYLASEFSRQMTTLGYLDQPLYRMKKVRSNEKNLPLYRLALFSRSSVAYKFWDDVLKYSTPQQNLFRS